MAEADEPEQAKARAEHTLAASIAQADSVVTLADRDGEAARRALLETLRAADKRLALKLAAMTPPGKEGLRFSAAQAVSYRTQIQIMIGQVEGKVGAIAVSVGGKAVAKSVAEGQALLGRLEQDYKGVSASPSVMAAMQQSHVLRGPKAALVTRVATSLDRYGHEMGGQFSKIIAVGLTSGASNAEMVAQLVGHGGPRGPKVSLAAREIAPGVVQRIREGDIPEGLFVRHKYWAERIVRTEVAHAYSSTRYEQLLAMRAAGHDTVKKKIVAVFDARTAADSIAVHGQVRELEDPFVDGKGRHYQHPPGRPNDRETVLPWFEDWAEVPSTEPLPEAEQERAKQIADPDPVGIKPDDKPPMSRAELEERKRLEREAYERHQAERQVEREAERDSRASEFWIEQQREAMRREQQEKKQAKAAELLDKRLTKEWATKRDERHLVALDVIELAASDPEKFAALYNRKLHTVLKADTMAAMARDPVMFDITTREVLDKYGDGGVLDLFKMDPERMQAVIDALGKRKDALGNRRLAALVYTEPDLWRAGPSALPPTWTEALKLVSKRREHVLERLSNRYQSKPLPAGKPLRAGKPLPAGAHAKSTAQKAEFKRLVGDALKTGEFSDEALAWANNLQADIADHLGATTSRSVTSMSTRPTNPDTAKFTSGTFDEKGQMYIDPDGAAFDTVVHELIHGIGGAQAHAYRGVSAAIEEIATEELAQAYVNGGRLRAASQSKIFPDMKVVPIVKADLSDPYKLVEEIAAGRRPMPGLTVGSMAYMQQRERLYGLVAIASGETDLDRLRTRVLGALLRWKRTKYDTADQALSAMIDALEPNGEERAFFVAAFHSVHSAAFWHWKL